MFVDMRGSTQMAARQLPFDTMFIINRFLDAVSQAVTQAGGRVNQYLGDGLLALFGVEAIPGTACRQAISAAAMIARNIKQLNRELAATQRSPLRFGIGINGGEVIVGDIGSGDSVAFTVLGDAVNVAARLQEMTKDLECQVVVSQEVYKSAGLPEDGLPVLEIVIRGHAAPIIVRIAVEAERLTKIINASTTTSGLGE
jgi:adenylate cyclase